MEALINTVLIISLLGVFAVGYYFIAKTDKFISEKRDHIKDGDEERRPASIMLKDGLSDEEILKELNKFRADHTDVYIIVNGMVKPGQR